ncbi:MAG: hypothetical protein AMXMBFR78_04380 [Rubrivivax sp.]|nr:addiction module protein [Rubrivivax sp.]
MTSLVDELSLKALGLPPEERVRLAEKLLATVHGTEEQVQAVWDEEIQARLGEIDKGTAELIAAEDVFAEVRRVLR